MGSMKSYTFIREEYVRLYAGSEEQAWEMLERGEFDWSYSDPSCVTLYDAQEEVRE